MDPIATEKMLYDLLSQKTQLVANLVKAVNQLQGELNALKEAQKKQAENEKE
jgi:hypothetical protein